MKYFKITMYSQYRSKIIGKYDILFLVNTTLVSDEIPFYPFKNTNKYFNEQDLPLYREKNCSVILLSKFSLQYSI